MSLLLKPTSTNYLVSDIRFQQYQQVDEITVDTNNFTATPAPVVHTFGDGVIDIKGSVVAAGTPEANYVIGSLPAQYVPTDSADQVYPVAVIRAGAYVTNAVKVNTPGDSVTSVTITAAGSYETLPTLTATAPGSGCAINALMAAASSAVVAQGTGYAPGDSLSIVGGTSGAGDPVTLDVVSTALASLAVDAAGTNYVPAEVLTLVGGTSASAATVTVATTKVVSATIASPGSAGVNGTAIVTGTTGTGTKFQAAVTIAGGAISEITSISVGGSYTVNPTLLTAEPVTGGSLTGATLNIVIGVDTVTLTTGGIYTENSTTFTSTDSVSGAGATFNAAVYGVNVATLSEIPFYTALPANPVSTTGTGSDAQFILTWEIAGTKVAAQGFGYTSASQLSITGGGGTGGGAGVLVLDVNPGQLTLVNAPTVGDVVCLDNISIAVKSY